MNIRESGNNNTYRPGKGLYILLLNANALQDSKGMVLRSEQSYNLLGEDSSSKATLWRDG